VAIGTRVDVEKAHKGANTLVVDLGGKALLPGFLDAHSHTISSWTIANQANL
jgi:predicted amidohydrolase YtcJ